MSAKLKYYLELSKQRAGFDIDIDEEIILNKIEIVNQIVGNISKCLNL